jgi:hypothetical protein
MVTASFVAYQLVYVPGFARLNAGVGYGPSPDGGGSLSVSLLSLVRLGVLTAGLVTSAVVLWRLDMRDGAGSAALRERWKRDARLVGVIVGYWALTAGLLLV